MNNKNENNPLHVFIDANIFLDFYDLHHEDLESLDHLIKLVENEEIKLFTTPQVEREVSRHRSTRLSDAYKKFKDSKASISMPVICQAYPEYSQIRRIQKEIQSIKSDLSKKLWSDIEEKTLKADTTLSKLFEISEKLDSDSLIDRAAVRYRMGNPPGKKKGGYGDEINWEALLKGVPGDNHFILISGDGDYRSNLNEEKINQFLKEEWERKKESKIIFYDSLTSFFQEQEIDIELRWEEEKNKLVQKLSESPNFATTHEVIEKLSKFNIFEERQIIGIGRAAIVNSQVSWIAQDPDVNSFYSDYVLSNLEMFEEDDKEVLKEIFSDNFEEYNEDDFEDVPF